MQLAERIGNIATTPVNTTERKKLGIRSGDTVRVHQKIQEKGKTRIQMFEGLVIATKHGAEAGATFTVRKVSSGVGVEKIFPLYSPMIDKIEIVKRAKTRRAKIYFIREKASKEARRKMRRQIAIVPRGGVEEVIEAEEENKEAEASVAEPAETNTEAPENTDTQEVKTEQEESKNSDTKEEAETDAKKEEK